jgi:hypothetical protein
MKKVITILLAAVLTLSLVACGSGNGNTDAPTPSSTPAQEAIPESENIVLQLNETVTIGDYELTVTGINFTDSALDPSKDGSIEGSFAPQDGYTCLNIYFIVKYNGKTKIMFPYFANWGVDYNNGFIFESEREWFYDGGVKAWLNFGEIQPLTPAFDCMYSFFVPLEVRDNQDAPLNIFMWQSNAEEKSTKLTYAVSDAERSAYMDEKEQQTQARAEREAQAEAVKAELQGIWSCDGLEYSFADGTFTSTDGNKGNYFVSATLGIVRLVSSVGYAENYLTYTFEAGELILMDKSGSDEYTRQS